MTFPSNAGAQSVEVPVWCLVMFDLPVKTKAQRRLATRYRQRLLDEGFAMTQLSVYSKYVTTTSGVRLTAKKISCEIPRGGSVRMLYVSDYQWAKMLRFFGEEELEAEKPPEQLQIF